jgi:precorrin-8X/cobalt-precorrin-8 methylmutase
MMAVADYIHDPDEIYRQSFATVEREARLDRLPEAMRPLAMRLIHSCGMIDILDDLDFSGGAAEAGIAALKTERPVVHCDVEMVKAGITRKFLPPETRLVCTLNEQEVSDRAKAIGNTRSAAAVEFWEELEGSIVVIGNAPTALFHLLDRIAAGEAKPALIIGIPVGFIGAAESKAALAGNELGLEFVTVHGRRGGSAMAASIVNALASGLKS